MESVRTGAFLKQQQQWSEAYRPGARRRGEAVRDKTTGRSEPIEDYCISTILHELR